MRTTIRCLSFVILTISTAFSAGTVKVFILAGQSNMEGKAQNKLLEHQATDAKTAQLFAHLRKDGKWITRDDVHIKYLKHFINDVRKDLKSPKMPFVIGVMGQNGSKPAKGAMVVVKEAQTSMESVPEFKGTVKAVPTDVLIDKAAEKLYPDWKKHFEEWEKVGSDRGYHYLGSAIWFNRMGKAFGETMLELME